MISMNVVWEDTLTFLRRETAILIPLALATLLVGDVVNTLTNPGTGAVANSLLSVISLAAILWTIIGQMSIMALVLRPGSSVGEALSLAVRRLPVLVGAGILIGVAGALLLVPAAYGFIQSGVNPNVPASYGLLPGWVSFYIIVVACLAIWLSLRLSILNALIVDKRPGVIAAMKSAFAMTRGLISRLILVALVYFAMTYLLTTVVRFVLGSVFVILGRAVDSPFLGNVLTALATGVVAAALSTVAAVFLAMLYRRISTGI